MSVDWLKLLDLSDFDRAEPLVEGLAELSGLERTAEPMFESIASAILADLLRSSSLGDVFSASAVSAGSSVNPAAYISIASSTVKISPGTSSCLNSGRGVESEVISVRLVSLVSTLFRVVFVLDDAAVTAER